MMDILFRGKRVDNGQWVEGSLVTESLEFSIIDYACRGSKTYTWNDVDSFSVGQYTGRLDFKKNKIFKDDIVIIENCGRHVVKWHEASCAFYMHNEYTGDMREFNRFKKESLEVLGNIHDNPELLK